MIDCHYPDESTVQRLSERKNGSWRTVAVDLGYRSYYAATLCNVAAGKPGCISRDAENVLRIRLGLEPIMYIEVPPCPDCGSAHTGRCHNKPVAQVVILSPGERVYRRKPAQRWADMPVVELKRAVEGRRPYKGKSNE